MIRRLVITIVAVALLAAACGTDEEPADPDLEGQRPFILATTALVGDLVENVVGRFADVEVLVPLGEDPTSYELTSRQQARLREAALVVSVGAGFEASAEEELDRAASDGAQRFELTTAIKDPLPGATEGTTDPYLWLDPERTADAVLSLGNRLGEASAVLASAEVTDAAAAYARTLRETAQAMDETLSDLDTRTVGSGQRSLAYFAERYDIEIVTTIDPQGQRRAITSAVRALENTETQVILASTFEADDIADALTGRSELALEVQSLHIDDLGEPTSAEGTYVGLLEELGRQVRLDLT